MKFIIIVICSVIFCNQLMKKVESLKGESIVFGILTQDEDLQYMVLLLYKDEPLCAGGIIGDRHILTAAHCVILISEDKFRDDLDVLAGTHDLLHEPSYDDYGSLIKVAVEKIFVPSIYNSSFWKIGQSPQGDIAVLKLRESLRDLPKLKLPSLSKEIYPSNFDPYDAKVAKLGGFGYERVELRRSIFGRVFIAGEYSSRKLHHGHIRIVNVTECQKHYTSHVWETKFCGRMIDHDEDTPQGTCVGDSGSPLVFKGDIVIGVLTGAQAVCGNENVAPSQYTSLLAFREFVQNAMDEKTDGMRVHEAHLITLLLVQNGARALEGEGIIGGDRVNLNELSYQVSIQMLGLHGCGGAIIDESHVITAAHCVIDDENNDFISLPLTVVAGTIDINDLEGHEYEVEKVYIPKEFDTNDIPTIYDIAVLKLRTKLDLNDSSLSALSLPSSSIGKGASRVSYAGEEALISGFGWDHVEVKHVPIPEDERTKNGKKFYEIEDGDSTGYLLKAKTRIVTNRECQRHYRHLIYKNQLCAKVIQYDENVSQGVCSGDSGGPLVHDDKTLIGVVSYSPIGCDDSTRPAVYTRVSYFIDFIDKARKNIVTETMRSHTW